MFPTFCNHRLKLYPVVFSGLLKAQDSDSGGKSKIATGDFWMRPFIQFQSSTIWNAFVESAHNLTSLPTVDGLQLLYWKEDKFYNCS